MIKKAILFLFLAASVFGAINSFNAGELSPLLDGRYDLEKYYSGCRTLENFIVLSQGGVTKRPGTKYIASTKTAADAAMITSFEFSVTQAYILEFGDEYIRFYKDGGQIQNDAGTAPYEISTPYDITDLFELQFFQSADTMYIVHEDYAPRKLTRTGHTAWTLTTVDFQRGPFLDENITDTTVTATGYTIAADATAETFTITGSGDLSDIFTDNKNFVVGGSTANDGTWTVSSTNAADPFIITVTGNITSDVDDGSIIIVDGTVTLTASTALFDTTNHIGALWQVSHTVDSESASGSFTSPTGGTSASVSVQLGRRFDFTTHGSGWTGTCVLQRSYDGGSVWKDVLPVHYENDGNASYSESEKVADAIYRVNMTTITAGTMTYNLISRSFDNDGVAKITAVASTTSATATVQNLIGDTTATKYWSEGAWSLDEGYPSTGTLYEERAVYAATTNSPQTIWLSQSDDWDNFLAGTDDSDALKYTIASDQVNAIRWIASQNVLLIGTTGGEWKMSADSANESLTPNNKTIRKQSSFGSAYIKPVSTDNVVLYIQRQSRKVREMAYSYEIDGWVSPDLSVLAEHITQNGIDQTAYQKTPDPILWCVVDGDLAALTYNREHEVVAWHLHTFDGDVESVAVIPGSTEDEVWILISREIEGSTVRYIEQFQPRYVAAQEDMFFVDSGLSFDGGAAVTVTSFSQAIPASVTAAGHGFSDGDQVRFSSLSGMTEANNKVFTVDDATTNTFTLNDKTDSVNIDSTGFTAYISGGTVQQVENAFTGLDHLEDELVSIVVDGGYYGTATVASGIVTLADYYNTVHIGLGYTSKLLPMRIAVPGQNISSRTKRITKVTLRFFETSACKVGSSWTDYDNVVFRDADDPLESSTPLFTGEKDLEFEGDYETAGNIYLQSDLSVPCTILFIEPEFEVGR